MAEKTTFIFQLPKELKDNAQSKADLEGESLATIIRKFLKDYVNTK